MAPEAGADALGAALRAACAARREKSVADVEALLAAGADAGAPNVNKKRPLHFAAQLRPDSDVAKALLDAGAAPDTPTRRGHTPLVFAAGRGHAATVELLLDHGASAAVRTVNGDTPLKLALASGSMPPHVVERLRHSEAAGPWRDFTDDADALVAQRLHARECRCCQAKLAARGLMTPAQEAAAAVASHLRDAAQSAGGDLAGAVLEHAGDAASLRGALAALLGEPGVALELLRACRDEPLGRRLAGKDRRPVRVVAGALLRALNADDGVARLAAAGVELADAVDVADPFVAASLVAGWPEEAPLEVVLPLWRAQVDGGSNQRWVPEAVRPRKKRDGGPKVAAWARALRWAAQVSFAGWEAEAAGLLRRAKESRLLGSLLVAARQGGREPVPEALSRLLEGWKDEAGDVGDGTSPESAPQPRRVRPKQAPSEARGSELEPASLPVEFLWVADATAVARAREELAAELAAGSCPLGLDTEWDDEPADVPAVVQLATARRAWVVDTLPSAEFHGAAVELVRWALSHPNADPLGFAFGGDTAKLQALCGGTLDLSRVRDLQREALREARDTPSLAAVVASVLEKRLDKTEQCSAWAQRPLTQSQLKYAALDAHVLVGLAAALDDNAAAPGSDS